MTEEQIFKNRFPEYCVGEECLSPYFDLFQIGFEEGENQNKELQEENTEAKNLIEELASSLSVVGECELINKAQKFINKPIF